MSRARHFGSGAALHLLLWACVLGAATRPSEAHAGRAAVSQVSGGLVYIEAGRKDGLLEGDTVCVLRAQAKIAWLRATYLASHRAACDTLRTLAAVGAGDSAEFTPHVPSPSAGPVPASGRDSAGAAGARSAPVPGASLKSRAAGGRASPAHIRGRAGLTYLMVSTEGGGQLHQVGLDFRLDGTRMWDAPLDLSVDVRGRRTSFLSLSGASQSQDLNRVYRLNLMVHDQDGHRLVTFGRQIASGLSPVSLFDGVLAESRGPRWNSGLFLGTQPEPIHLGPDGSIVELGGYVEWHQPEGSERHWSLGGGMISSRDSGSPNRDFAFSQVYYNDRRLSAAATQELDFNRGWKRDLGEPLLSPTSTFLSASLKLLPWLSARGGYDDRRNVRLYRDYVSPETQFDDRYRQGAWTGLSLEKAPHLRFGVDVRSSSIGGTDNVATWAASGEVYRIGAVNAAVRARVSRADGDGLSTSLSTLGVGLEAFSGGHLELGAGTRTTTNQMLGIQDDSHWLNGSLDLSVARRGYLNFSLERDQGGLSPQTQLYSGFSWRY